MDLAPTSRRPGGDRGAGGRLTAAPAPRPGAGRPPTRAEVKFAAGLRVPPPRYTGGIRQVYPRSMPCGRRTPGADPFTACPRPGAQGRTLAMTGGPVPRLRGAPGTGHEVLVFFSHAQCP